MLTLKTLNSSCSAFKAHQDFGTAKRWLFNVPFNWYGLMARPFSLPNFIRNVVIFPVYNHLYFLNLTRKRARIKNKQNGFNPTLQKVKPENSGCLTTKRPPSKSCRMPDRDGVRLPFVDDQGISMTVPVPRTFLPEVNAARESSLSPAYAGMYVLRRFGLL